MARRHHYRRRIKQPMELEVTTFLNLMVVLVPFLLITAVFSRITIVELSLPSSAGGPAQDPPSFRVEVIVREQGLEVGDGSGIIASIPNVDSEYDWPALSEQMVDLKRRHSDVDTASVLLEPQIPYDYLIRAMDVVRSVELPGESAGEFVRAALFTDISVGVAP